VRKSLVTGSAFGPFFPLGKIHLEAEKYILSRKTIGFYYGVGGGGRRKTTPSPWKSHGQMENHGSAFYVSLFIIV
jgi:hypothetical protein